MIDWKEGAVCFADNRQWSFNDSVKPYKLVSNMHGTRLEGYSDVVDMPDLQLNTIKQGDYIEASELDTEQKYNDAVEVFGLFGFKDVLSYRENVDNHAYDALILDGDGGVDSVTGRPATSRYCKRKITYPQLMAIGKLKRAMIEREMAVMVDKITAAKPVTKVDACNELGVPIPFKPKRNKSKQAYDILKALDYEYDLVKQRWYKKEWV